MGLWILLGILVLLILWRVREHYVIIEGPGARPSRNAEWLSKIDASAPIGGNDDDYLKVLQKFYDEIYEPARKANPTVFIKDTEVKTFSDSITTPGVDKELRWIELEVLLNVNKMKRSLPELWLVSRVKIFNPKWVWMKCERAPS